MRRSAAQKSISLDRKDVGNWRSRVEAHRTAARILSEASPLLGSACRVKFLEYDLRMYLRELGRDPEYQAAWWTLTREYVDTFPEADIESAAAHARWIVSVLRATPTPPADVERLTRLAAEPPRLLPPYANGPSGEPVWSDELPVELVGLRTLPVAGLPVTVDAEPAGRGAVRIRVHDLYGRLAEAGPVTAQLSFMARAGGEAVLAQPVELKPDPDPGHGGGWIAVLPFRLADLAVTGRRRGLRRMQAWNVGVGVRCADGSSVFTSLRPRGKLLRRQALPSSRYGVLLAQPYRTGAGALALRLAPGAEGALDLVRNRLHRARSGRGRADGPGPGPCGPVHPTVLLIPKSDRTKEIHMTFLITGGAGYIGSHVVRAMMLAGQEVVVLDDLSTGNEDRVPEGVGLVVGSVLDRLVVDEVIRKHKITGVVHLAGKKQVGESVEKPMHYYHENVQGLAVLLQAVADAGIRNFLFSSSASVYGMPDVDLVTEDTPCAPLSPYGETKLAGEWLVRAAGKAHGISTACLRYFNVAGAATPELADTGVFNLVPMVFERFDAGQGAKIFGDDYPTPDGTCIRDYIHVEDLAEAHVAAARKLAEWGAAA